MGLAEIRELIKPVIKEVDLSYLSGKIVALDAFNALYQFLAAIRQPDGTPLKDSKGRITSHLSGLFYRNKNLIENGIKLIYVFDGRHPEFKKKEQELREEQRKKMEEKYEIAKEAGEKNLKKYAEFTSKLDYNMIDEAKELLKAMGVPYIQAPSEGEAEAAYLVKKNIADFVGSQDYDSLLFGGTRVVRNITISGKRKIRGVEVNISPEIIELKDVLNYLNLNQEKLIILALVVGTDYNPDGIKGIGIKKAYEIVKKYDDPEKIFNYINWDKYYDISWKELEKFFLDPPVVDINKEDIKFGEIDEEKIRKILIDNHDFSEERVNKSIEELKKSYKQGSQKNLLSFFQNG
ncbi:flap endonuclease 1 [Nanobdella aerobiophila]|uniref:Flap endonuclease 1 n=1 Tax=Nanobdella aerobiophila TaxID=2586965 RepID=A0A915WT00_9ARCH|nr:flap endonuclease-1 [Nanobdella aerobiophila]BBL45835.1 flap endonuclease 1 [Nanobdella aerobiophila]